MSRRWLHARTLVAFCAIALTPAIAHADPVITGFNQTSVPMEANIIIYGSGFGSAQGQSYVLIGGRLVTVTAWSDGAIYVLINPLDYDPTPLALNTAYPVQVVVQPANKTSNAVNLTINSEPPPAFVPGPGIPTTVDQPAIAGFQKATFCDGNFMTIYGNGFGTAEGSSYVTIKVPITDANGNNIIQEYGEPTLAWSENAITVLLSLPSGAQFGTYTATIHRSNGKSASADFAVGACS